MSEPHRPNSDEPGPLVLERLRDVERCPLDALVLYQARRMEILLRHARRHVPFYNGRLDPVFDADGAFDLSRWQDVPVLTRDEAEGHAEALRAAETPDEAGGPVADRTSGSGGSPFHFVRSGAVAAANAGNSLRIFVDHGFDFSQRMCDIRLDLTGDAAWPDGQMRPDWTHGTGAGDYGLLSIDTGLEKQIDWLLRLRPHTLFTWPSNARRIALELEKSGRSLPLTTLATSGELCTRAVRADCRRVFGLDPVDVLGAREIGILAFPCNRSRLYHFTAETAFLEVIGDDGRPAGPGETGQIVATGLYNFHMPFIRYAVGDYVTLADRPCTCGRSLPAISKIHGRARHRFEKGDGRKVFPEIPEAELDAIAGPYGWQIAQTGAGTLEFRVDGVDTGKVEARRPDLSGILARAFGEPLRLTIVERALQPGPGRRKHEPFRNETG